MLLKIVKYGTPVLRKKGAQVHEITPAIRQLIADMFETMYENRGVGLAAQQVGHAIQLAVLDIRGITDRPSTLEIDGKAADPAELMPLVLINPKIKPVGPEAKGPEGCLSFPEIYADITRPDVVDITTLDQSGKEIKFRCGGLLSRAAQHEADHLNGILFIDRMDKATKAELRPELEDLQADTKAKL